MADVDLDALSAKVETADGTTQFVTAECRMKRQEEVVDAVPALIAELRKHRERLCTTCEHGDGITQSCRLLTTFARAKYAITFRDVGGGCRAHKLKV